MADPVAISIGLPLWDKRRSLVVYGGWGASPLAADSTGPFPSKVFDLPVRGRLPPTQFWATPPVGPNGIVPSVIGSEFFDLPLLRKPPLNKTFAGWMNSDNFPPPVVSCIYVNPVLRKPPLPKGFMGWMNVDAVGVSPLTGVIGTGSVGNVGVNLVIALGGNTATGAVGSATYSASIDLTLPISGVGAAGGVGSTAYSIDTNFLGNAGQATAGSVTYNFSQLGGGALSGVVASGFAGQLGTYQTPQPFGGNKCFCSVCGFIRPCSQLKIRWDGVLTCSDCWEPRQPQDFVRGVVDKQIVEHSNAEPFDTFLNPGDVKPSDL